MAFADDPQAQSRGLTPDSTQRETPKLARPDLRPKGRGADPPYRSPRDVLPELPSSPREDHTSLLTSALPVVSRTQSPDRSDQDSLLRQEDSQARERVVRWAMCPWFLPSPAQVPLGDQSESLPCQFLDSPTATARGPSCSSPTEGLGEIKTQPGLGGGQ